MFSFKMLCRERPSIPSLCSPSMTRASFLNTSNRLKKKKKYLVEKPSKKKSLSWKKNYQFKFNSVSNWLRNPKRELFPLLHLIKYVEQSRYNLLLGSSLFILNTCIVSKYKHTIWGWNNPKFGFYIACF